MQTLPNSPPLLRHPAGDDDVDIDFRDVFGGPPKRRSKVIETTGRHSFSEIRRRDVIVDNSALILRDEKPVFGEDPSSIRRRFTADDFFDDIFRVNESSSSSSPQRKVKNEGETFGSSLPGSRILSPARPIPHKVESPPGTSFPAQFSLPAKLIKGTEMPTFGSAARSLSRNKEAASSSPLSRTSSSADMVNSTAKPDSDGYVAPKVVNGKVRQFHFSIYKWPNKGVPVAMWGTSRLSSMAKAEETTPSDLRPTSFEAEGQSSQKRPGVQKEEEMSEQAFSSNVSKAPDEANVKPQHSFLDVKDERQGEEIELEKEERKGKSKAKSMRSHAGDSRSKKKAQGSRSSVDSPMPDNTSSYASASSAPEVGKDGAKGKVMDFVKIFSQGASAGAGGEPLGQSSRWRAKEVPVTDTNKDDAKAKETAKVPDQQKTSTPVTPAMDQDQKPSQATQKKVADSSKPSGVTEQEEKQEPSTAHVTSEDIDEPFHVNFLVEDITQDENKMEETKNNAEEFQNIDAKIRKWSSGKSGNIRSLLSTLQYILWPGCGWKAVPLMDMIEGNAVRKSYQRALLILHPDKLQQKGASANQKYMATADEIGFWEEADLVLSDVESSFLAAAGVRENTEDNSSVSDVHSASAAVNQGILLSDPVVIEQLHGDCALSKRSVEEEATSGLGRDTVSNGSVAKREMICYEQTVEEAEWSFPDLDDLMEQYNSEKLRLESVSAKHAQVLSEFMSSYSRLRLLHEKTGNLRKLLLETEKEMACCEAEALELGASCREVAGEMAEAQNRMQVMAAILGDEVELLKQKEFVGRKRRRC